MSGHNLPENFVLDPEALLKKKMTHASTSSAVLPTTVLLTSIPATNIIMA
jgi:hypothetical protein